MGICLVRAACDDDWVTPLAFLAQTSRVVAETRSRTAKVRSLAECLRCLAPEEVGLAVCFLTGTLRQGKVGIGATLVSQASTAPAAATAQLTLAEVDRIIAGLAAASGPGSANRRRDLLRTLFSRATAAEQEFLARLLLGELRQGALQGLMFDAIAVAANVPGSAVRRAAMYGADLAAVAQAALHQGSAGLNQFRLVPLTPIAPMLAQPAENVAAALADLGEAALEWKLDGARVQVHKSGDQVRVYSRQLNDVSVAVPEVVQAVRALPLREVVLDGEAIALAAGGTPQPFPVTMRRFGRKADLASLRAELPLQVFFFDCLRWQDDDIADRPARERFELLERELPQALRIPRLITADVEVAQEFFQSALARGHEGLMAKGLDAPYEAGSRGSSWQKIKKAQTLDLVVLAAEWGHGRRTGWLSNLHLGARDAENGGFVMLGKTFKGLTDALLEWQTKELLAREIGRDAATVYVRPELVVEIAYNDLQASPHYPGGLALRFARVKRYRSDKQAAQADTIETVRKAYRAQGPR
ncbi:MAG TPA: ATP-dependent DNA ligase [Terriglobales bacterium]|nr:ATP-dependent DNA ligase [Terriglobales bacterium]